MLTVPLKNNLTQIEIPYPFRKSHSKHKSPFDILVSYHDLQLMVFITNRGLKGSVYILKVVLDILHKFIHDSQNACACLTLNKTHIKLASLILCSINYNLPNTSWTPPPEVTVLYIVNLVVLYSSKETYLYWKGKNKIFNLFETPNQHNCCATTLRKFLLVLIGILGKWSIWMQ